MIEFLVEGFYTRSGHVPECDDETCTGKSCWKHDDPSTWMGRTCTACKMPSYYHQDGTATLTPCEGGRWTEPNWPTSNTA